MGDLSGRRMVGSFFFFFNNVLKILSFLELRANIFFSCQRSSRQKNVRVLLLLFF